MEPTTAPRLGMGEAMTTTTTPAPTTEDPTPPQRTPGARATWVRHRPDCPGGALRYRREGGQNRAQCLACGGWGTAPGTAPAARPRTRSTPEPVPVIVLPFRCPEHQHRTVSARGKGCPDCQRAREERRRNKKRRRTPEPAPEPV